MRVQLVGDRAVLARGQLGKGLLRILGEGDGNGCSALGTTDISGVALGRIAGGSDFHISLLVGASVVN